MSLLFYRWFESRVKSKWARGNRCNIAANAASSSLPLLFFPFSSSSPLPFLSPQNIAPSRFSILYREENAYVTAKEREREAEKPSLREVYDQPPIFGPPPSTWPNFLLYSFLLLYQWSVFRSSPVFIYQFNFWQLSVLRTHFYFFIFFLILFENHAWWFIFIA